MGRLPVFGLVLSIHVLVFGPAAQGQQKSPLPHAVAMAAKAQTIADPGSQPPTIDVSATPDLLEFFFFFRHLASLDAAADDAVAEGNLDASQWKSHDQRAAGLTDEQGVILKAVAYACNQTLSDPTISPDRPAGRMAIVSAAMSELRSRLGEETFQTLAQYVHASLGPDIEVVRSPAATPLKSVASGTGEPGPPVDIEVEPTEIFVISHITKLPSQQVFAQCNTTADSVTAESYISVGTYCDLLGFGSDRIEIPCDPSFPGQCLTIYPSFPGMKNWTEGSHGLRLYPGLCTSSAGTYQGLSDPLHYCSPEEAQLPVFQISGTLLPKGGSACWQPNSAGACGLGYTVSRSVTFVDLFPYYVKLYPNQQQRFATNLPVVWHHSGPGTLDGTGLYKAPATITSPQTATVQACDANPQYPDDCISATIHLDPFKVELTPPGDEVLPGETRDFKATVTPAAAGLTVEWTLEDPTGLAAITPDEDDSSKAFFEAPGKDFIGATQEITVKACVKPNDSTEVCGTAKVRVPRIEILFIPNPATHTLPPNGTIQLTAVINGSIVPYELRWEPFPDLFGASLTVDTPDTLVATYKVSGLERTSVAIRACIKGTVEDFCSEPYRLDIVDAIKIDSVTGDWTAGLFEAPFTVAGSGFGIFPTVTFGGGGMQARVVSASDSLITGVVTIPVAMGGSPVSFVVRANSGTGGGPTVNFPSFGQTSPTIARISRLEVSPAAAEVRQGGSQPFSAICLTAKGALCNSPETVSWSASPGTIDPVGLSVQYRAPASVAASTPATVTACWVGGTLCAPSAHVTLLPPAVDTTVTVSPKTARIGAGQTQPFTATVTGNASTAVAWSLQPSTPEAGTINQSGLYTAPATLGGVTTVTVTATSQADGTKKDTATVTLVPAQPAFTGVTPSPAVAYLGTAITWTASVSGGDTPTIQYAMGRRRVGTADWTALVWQTSNVLSWTPAAADTGAWEIGIVVRDGTTPPNANGYGYAAYINPGNVQVVTPLTLGVTATPAWSMSGTAINWTATASGGATPATRQYALFRRRSGTTTWTPSVNAPAWQAGNALGWTPAAADAGSWDLYFWVKDAATPAGMNTYGYATGANGGVVQVVAPMTVGGTVSPASAYHGTTLTWTANASGGTASTTRYAFFRRRAGAGSWTPDVTAPAWQSSNVMSWTPASTDTGTWEIVLWAKDGNTPANMNTYGFAAYYNAGPVQVVTPPSLSVSGSPASATYGSTLTWTANVSGGTGTSVRYAFFRRRSGTVAWTPDVNSPAWQTSNTYSWTPTSADEGPWDTYVWVKDSATPPGMSTYGYAAGFNTGGVQIVAPAPLTVTGTASPATSPAGSTLTWTATTSGGVPSTVKYALFRRRAGASSWIPDVTAPSWQTSRTLSWTPTSADAGTWEIFVWVKDINTTPTQNTYGFAAYYNAQPVQVVAP